MAPDIGDRCDPSLCEDFPGLSCQLTGSEWEYAPARVANAEKGDLLLCPATSSGVIGTLLGALKPKQHFTHMGIFVSDRQIRQCTFIEDRLTDPDFMEDTLTVRTGDLGLIFPLNLINIDQQPAPLFGFKQEVVRFGWPGTVTLPVDDAIYGGLYANAYPQCRFLDAEHPKGPKAYSVHELTFEPVLIDDPAGGPGTITLPPLLVKPCGRMRQGLAKQIAWEVADTAASIFGHYRFYGYTDAEVAFDPTKQGPKRPTPVQGETDPAKLEGHETMPLVCSSFVWAAVRLTAKRLGMEIDLDATSDKVCPPALLPLEHEVEDKDATTRDGLYLYPAVQRLNAGGALFQMLRNKTHDQIADGITKESNGSHTLGLDSRSTVAGAILSHHPFDLSVANQLCSTFVADDPGDVTGPWQTTVGDGHSVSPDDIYRFWDQTVDSPGKGLQGLYGYNENAIVIYRRPEQVPIYTWQKSEREGGVSGIVKFQGQSVTGITVTLNCQHGVTGAHGYVIEPVKVGKYRVTAGMADPASGLYVSGFADVRVGPDKVVSAPDIILNFPSEDYRQVLITGHADLVDRQVTTKDHWEHPDILLRALQIGPGINIQWDPARMVWPLPVTVYPPFPDAFPGIATKHPAPDPNAPPNVRLGDWDYTEASYGFGGDELELRAYAELIPGTRDAHVILEARIIERDGGDIDLEVWRFADITIPENGSDNTTFGLKSAETAPDRADVTLTIRNLRSAA
jgi:hypothetical protein